MSTAAQGNFVNIKRELLANSVVYIVADLNSRLRAIPVMGEAFNHIQSKPFT